MSFADVELPQRRAQTIRIWSSAGFIALLLLSVAWPAPVVWLNDATLDLPLSITTRSFLGREAPSWDVVYWAIAGLYALAMIHAGLERFGRARSDIAADLRSTPRRLIRRFEAINGAQILMMVIGGILLVAFTWFFLDGAIVSLAETARTDGSKPIIRLMNRLGGGMNPAMIVGFFFLAGMVLLDRRWWLYSLAMSCAGLSSGLVAQLVKEITDRSRPEVWLGPFHFVESASTSFPSGHTVGAFALAAVLIFRGRAVTLRLTALAVAVAIAASRVIGFRHWPSDVVASALMGLLIGWFFATAILQEETAEAVEQQPVAVPSSLHEGIRDSRGASISGRP
jgi:membrane-associated phospholipid phosphatase